MCVWECMSVCMNTLTHTYTHDWEVTPKLGKNVEPNDISSVV